MRAMAGRTAGLIKTKLGMGTYVDPGSVLGKVKVMWCHLANANKTPYRGPTEFERKVLRGPRQRSEAHKGRENSILAPHGEYQFLTEARRGRENSMHDKYGGQRPTGPRQ